MYCEKDKSGYEIGQPNSRFARTCQAGKVSDMRGCNSEGKKTKQTTNRVIE